MLLLPLLPVFLRLLGMKWTLVIGMAAWGIRYAVFSLGHPLALVIASLALHGLCYDFFFVAAYIHVDNKATPQIRASAQALFNLVVMGLGMWIGNEAFGRLVKHSTTAAGVDWQRVWLYPTVVVVVALAMFVVGFRERKNPVQVSPNESI
jgi:MFS family permease